MKCINHPDLYAIGMCVECGKELCGECTRELDGKLYCQACADAASTAPVSKENKRKTIRAILTAPVTKETIRKMIGAVLIVIGIAGAICSFIVSVNSCNASRTDEMALVEFFYIGIPGMLFSLGILVTGRILYLGKSSSGTDKSSAHIVTDKPSKSKSATGISAAALVCGLLSFQFIIGFFYAINLMLGLLAIILGSVSLAKLKRNPSLGGRRTAIAGLVLGIIGILVWIVCYVLKWF